VIYAKKSIPAECSSLTALKSIARLLRFERKISMLRDIYLIPGDVDGYSDRRISRLC